MPLSHSERLNNAVRSFYIYTTGFILMSASYSVTEYLREEDNVQSPYWFILYATLFSIAEVTAHYAAKYKSDPVARPLATCEKRSVIPKLQGTLHFIAETTEDGLLLTGLTSDVSKSTPNDSARLLMGFIALAAIRSASLRYHHHTPSRVIEELNRWIYNAVKCMGVFYGLGINWLYNDLNDETQEQVARRAIILGGGLITLYNIIERIGLKCVANSEKTARHIRIAGLMAEEMFTANIFFTILVTNTMANVINCNEECSQDAVVAAFYASNAVGLLLGIGRALNVMDYKPHRITAPTETALVEIATEASPLLDEPTEVSEHRMTNRV